MLLIYWSMIYFTSKLKVTCTNQDLNSDTSELIAWKSSISITAVLCLFLIKQLQLNCHPQWGLILLIKPSDVLKIDHCNPKHAKSRVRQSQVCTFTRNPFLVLKVSHVSTVTICIFCIYFFFKSLSFTFFLTFYSPVLGLGERRKKIQKWYPHPWLK